jgi:NAD(P)H-nitrite reductase large subunit
MLVIGVRPETQLAKAAGLELGQRGGIKVDSHMRTTDPSIFAVGEYSAVRVLCAVSMAGLAQQGLHEGSGCEWLGSGR